MYQGDGRGVIDHICAQHRRTLGHSHQVTNILIELDGDRASSESCHVAALRVASGDGVRQIWVWGRGYCMEPERFHVFAAQNKLLTIHFAAGEERQDMELALRSIADGRVDVGAWIGERIGLGAVADAVARMSGPSAPIRSVVDPRRP